jgi:cupin fold WbuC family metalloprotein
VVPWFVPSRPATETEAHLPIMPIATETRIKNLAPDVFVTNEDFPSAGRADFEFLLAGVAASPRGRIRTCMHKTNEDRMHEMFIAFTGNNYVRPSLHVSKDESLHVLEGEADYFFFDAHGQVTETVSLGPYGSPYQFYCRIPASTEHALLIRSDRIAIHETTVGPFRREDTVFSPWSPPESDDAGIKKFLADLRRKPRVERPLLRMQRTAEEVFVTDETIVSVGLKEMEFLKRTVHETTRKRVRLCAHPTTENTLHEMFVVYMDMTYVKPNMHIRKDESLHILEGEADFIFFDEQGQIQEVVPLGDDRSGRQFYIRVPAFVYHTIVMRSETLVIHEITPGPFRREDTVWAPWAPAETDLAAVATFMSAMREAGSKGAEAATF